MKYFNLLVITLVFSILAIPQEATAQDPRFAQFYAAPLQLNPAMTGVFEGRWRINANYRDQGSSILESNPFRTAAAAFDMRYNVVGNDYFAFGVSAMRDEKGIGNLVLNRGHLNLSYIKQMSGGGYGSIESYLVAGAQGGVGQSTVDWNQFWYSTQFDNDALAPNTNINSNEPGVIGANSSTDMYMDFNAGILWYALFGNGGSFYAGAAANHLNAPNVSFIDGSTEELYMRWVGHIGGELPVTQEISLMPAIAVMGQGPHSSITAGLNVRYTSHDWNEVAIRAGVWPHIVNRVSGESTKISMDAMTVALILEMNRINLGLSYDVTTSNLKLANNSRGAFEMSLIYTHPEYRRVKTKCPKF